MDQAALQQFWATVLNGTPKYCSPYNTIPILDPKQAQSYLFLQEITALLPIPFMAIGLLINLIFLLSILRAVNMRTVINVYLGNLAVVDMLFLAVIGGVNIDKKYMKPAIYHESLLGCYFTSAAEAVIFYGAVTLITLAVVNHICAKTSLGFAKSKGGNTGAASVSWLVAIGFGCLAAIQFGDIWRLCFVWPKFPPVFQHFPNGYDKCAPGPIEDKRYALYLDLIKVAIFFLGLLVNIILYAILSIKGSSTDDGPDVTKQVSRLLVVSGILCFLCHTVNRVLNIFDAMEAFAGLAILDLETSSLLKLTGSAFVYLNSATRPVGYFICSRAYRRGFAAAFTGSTNIDDVKSDATQDTKNDIK